MSKKIAFLTKLIILILLTTTSNAFDLKIVPPNKPLLNKEIKESKILNNIIKPKQKPQKNIVTTEETVYEKKIKPKEKPQKNIVTTEETVDENQIAKEKIINIIIPKTKPLVVKKEIEK